MPRRKVVIVMPFGGNETAEKRAAILNFQRLRYLIEERVKVRPAPTGVAADNELVQYDVEVCRTAVDEISKQVLARILDADVLLALIVGSNLNVIYEVAYRRPPERNLILVVDSPENLPLYLKGIAYHTWNQDAIVKRISAIANAPDELPALPDFKEEIPSDLEQAIDRYDVVLQSNLEQSLQEIELKDFREELPGKSVLHLRGIVSNEIATFYPSSIVEVKFAKRGEFLNPRAPAVIRHFDDEFAKLYGFLNKGMAEAECPLALAPLLDRLEKFSEPGDWAEFMKEQVELTDTVVRQYGFAIAKVPLRINGRHPRGEFRNHTFLPAVVAQVIDGKREGLHTMYLLVMYIDVTDLTTQPGNAEETLRHVRE